MIPQCLGTRLESMWACPLSDSETGKALVRLYLEMSKEPLSAQQEIQLLKSLNMEDI